MTIDDDVQAVRGHLSNANPVPPGAPLSHPVAPGPSAYVSDPGRFAERPRRSRLRLAFVGAVGATAVALVVALVLTAGGGSKSNVTVTGSGAKAVLASFQATKAAGSARGSFSLTVGDQTATGQGVGDFDTLTASGSMNLPDGQGTVDVIASADGFYVRPPADALGEGITQGKPWFKVDRSVVATLAGSEFGALGSTLTSAPFDILNYVKAVSGEVRTVGTEDVRGASTTHYSTAIDLSKVVGQLPASVQGPAQRAATAANQPVPADLWVDAQGRLRKLTISFDLSKVDVPTSDQPILNGGGTATATFELFDFGVPVSVTPPPADQVNDLGSMISGFLGGHTGP